MILFNYSCNYAKNVKIYGFSCEPTLGIQCRSQESKLQMQRRY